MTEAELRVALDDTEPAGHQFPRLVRAEVTREPTAELPRPTDPEERNS